MLNFTEPALATIKRAMSDREPAAAGLRLGVMGSPCSGLKYVIRLETGPASDDQVIECQGLTLFIDIDSYSQLQGVVVDYVEEGERRGFTFDNPNLTSRCSSCDKKAS